MKTEGKRWELLHKSQTSGIESLINVLLENRGIKDSKEFFNPTDPEKITLKSIGVKEDEVKKAIERVKKAKKNKEQVIIYGDYDADGITATAIMWESLHSIGLDVLPHIPDRFEEGYGINAESVKNLESKIPDLKLIITVDNGVVGYNGIETANKLGIDVIIVDHHQRGKKLPDALSLIHTDKVCGSALAWFFARELLEKVGPLSQGSGLIKTVEDKLELAAIGTVADQMPLMGINRSIVKYGLEKLNSTKRPGLRAILESSKVENVGTYEINYIIAPRINAMGRLAQGIDSLRLLCTTKLSRAKELSELLNKTNLERQKIVDQVVIHALGESKGKSVPSIIVLANETYHEGVIGLAAGKLVEEFYRPAIVFSTKGNISKASARSISGFNIIEAIRAVNMHLEGGGHPMAAGFSIETEKISIFSKEINKYADKILTDELLARKLKIDCVMNFNLINFKLVEEIKKFEPTGLGNPTPTFISKNVEVVGVRTVGREAKHLKFKLKKDGQIFDSIFFGGGENYSKLSLGSKIDIAFQIEENLWNGNRSIQLMIRDIHI
jgi:single-stranded-DNA-specific exonuclease